MATYKGIGYDTTNARTRTGTSADIIEFDAQVNATDGIAVTGDASVSGDLTVLGDIISRGAVDLVVQDPFIDLNFANTTTTSESGGLTVQMNRTSGFTASTVTAFTAGVAGVSNPTFTNTDAGGSSLLAAGDVVVITGATEEGNNGLYVVSAVSGASFPQTVTIKGTGTTATDASTPWAQTQYEAETGATASAFKTDLFVQLVADGSTAFTDSGGSAYNKGTFLTAYHEAATESDFSNDGGYTTVESTLQSAYNGGNTITTASSTDIGFTLASGGFSVSGAGSVNLTPTGASSFTSAGALTLTAAAASTWSTSSGALTLTSAAACTWSTAAGLLSLEGAAGVTVTSTGGTLTLNGTGQTVDVNSAALDIDASGAITVDGTSTLSLDAADTTNLTMAANTASAKTLSIVASNADAGAANVGNIHLDSDGNVEINSSGASNGSLQIGNDNNATPINIGTGGNKTIQVGQTGTNNSTIQLTSRGGTLLLDATGQTIDADGNLDQDGDSWNLNAAAGSSSINIAANDTNVYTLGIQGANSGDGHVVVDIDSDNSVQINGAAASNFTTSGGGLTLEGAAGVTVTSTGGTLLLNGTGQVVDVNGTNIDIDDAGETTIDSVGISLDSSAASNFSTSAGALTLTSAAAATWSTAAGNLAVTGAGGLELSDGTATLDLDGSGALTTSGLVSGSVTPSAAFDLDAGGGITIDGSSLLIGDDGDTAGISVLSTSGNIQLQTATSGNISITSVGTFGATSTTYDIDASGAFTLDAATVTIGGDSDTGDISISSASGDVEIASENGTKEVRIVSNYPKMVRGINAGAAGVAAGDCLYAENNGGLVVSKTDADAAATSQFVGVAMNSAASGNQVNVVVAGIAQQVTGDAAFVAATNLGKKVYLSTDAGKVTLTPPSAAGDVVFQVGICLGGSGTDWEVLIQSQFIMEVG